MQQTSASGLPRPKRYVGYRRVGGLSTDAVNRLRSAAGPYISLQSERPREQHDLTPLWVKLRKTFLSILRPRYLREPTFW
jgi:hypothetical protein